jgi:hypothetical protein
MLCVLYIVLLSGIIRSICGYHNTEAIIIPVSLFFPGPHPFLPSPARRGEQCLAIFAIGKICPFSLQEKGVGMSSWKKEL